LHYKQLEGNY